MIPMPKEDTTSRTKRRKKETTLREVVVKRVKLSFELYGLEVAMKEFDEMKVKIKDKHLKENEELTRKAEEFYNEVQERNRLEKEKG